MKENFVGSAGYNKLLSPKTTLLIFDMLTPTNPQFWSPLETLSDMVHPFSTNELNSVLLDKK